MLKLLFLLTLFNISLAHENKNLAENLNKLIKNTVFIKEGNSHCAGSIVGVTGLVLTAKHCVDDEKKDKYIELDGKMLEYKYIAFSKNFDMALIKLKDKKVGLLLADKTPLLGSTVYTVGHPVREKNILTKGIVSDPLRVELDKSNIHKDSIRYHSTFFSLFNIAVYFGNSGGSIVNESGEIISLVSMVMLGSYMAPLSSAQGVHLDDIKMFIESVE